MRRSAGAWPLLDSNRMGAHAAMCAGGLLVLLSISLLLSLLTPATEGVELFMRLGVCVSFWLPSLSCRWGLLSFRATSQEPILSIRQVNARAPTQESAFSGMSIYVGLVFLFVSFRFKLFTEQCKHQGNCTLTLTARQTIACGGSERNTDDSFFLH